MECRIRKCTDNAFCVVQFTLSTPIGLALVDVDLCMSHGAAYDSINGHKQRSWEGMPAYRAYEQLSQMSSGEAAVWHALWVVVDGKVTARTPEVEAA